MYLNYAKFNPFHRVYLLYRDCPLLGGSVMGSSTVYSLSLMINKGVPCMAMHLLSIYINSIIIYYMNEFCVLLYKQAQLVNNNIII